MVAAYHFCDHHVHNVPLLPETPWPDCGPAQQWIPAVAHVLMAGHAAVMVFFVISGFVLRLSLEHGPQTFGPAAAKFLIARAFRIFPIVAFGVAMTALSLGGIVGQTDPHRLTVFEYVANSLLLQRTVNLSYWALQVELLMAPAILVLYFVERRHGPSAVLATGIVTSLLLFTGPWLYWRPLSINFFSFVLGMTIPTFGRTWVKAMSKRAAILWTLGAALVLFSTRPCLGLYTRYSTFIEGYAGAVLVGMVAYRSDLSGLRFLDWRGLSRPGVASGSYYVLHSATFGVSVAAAAWLVPAAWSVEMPAVVGVLVITAWLIALVPVSMASYRMIEAPGITLGKRVIRRFGLDRTREIPVSPRRLAA
jgi:peptidoglycan/LPS O-acetylase OafA/YrhL